MNRLAISLICSLSLIFGSDASGTELIGEIPEDVAIELKQVFSEGVLASVGAGYVRRIEPEDNRYLQSIENAGGEFILTYGQRGQWSKRYFALKRCFLKTNQCRWEVQRIEVVRR